MENLLASFMSLQIQHTYTSLLSDKGPGPDGFTHKFHSLKNFHLFWSVPLMSYPRHLLPKQAQKGHIVLFL